MKRIYTHNPGFRLAGCLWLMCLLMVAWSSCSQAEVADSIEGGNGEAPLEVRAVTGAEVDTRAPAAVELSLIHILIIPFCLFIAAQTDHRRGL